MTPRHAGEPHLVSILRGCGWTLMLMACLAPGTPARGAATTRLRVSAAISLDGAFHELARLFERAHPGTRVQLNLAGSQQLAAQLAFGGESDVFAAADWRWIEDLRARGLLAGEPEVFAHNRVVVIVPRANPGRLAKPSDLARPGVKLVIAAEAVPAGRYAREVLARLARLPGYGSDFAHRALANVVSEEDNVRGVVARVELGEADAGLAYGSDVTPSVARAVREIPIPDSANVVTDYPIASLRGSRHGTLAREFVRLVRSERGQQVLSRHGFSRTGIPANLH